MKKFLTEEEVDSQEPKRPSFYKLRVFAFMNLYTLSVFFPIFAMTSFLMSYLAETMEIFLPLMPFLYFCHLYFKFRWWLITECMVFNFYIESVA